jgi:hypothetical protein
VLEEKVATRELPFHWTVDEDTKFSPVIVNVNAVAPAVAEFGLSETIEGIGFDVGGGGWLPPEFPDPPPPQPDKNSNETRPVSARILERALTIPPYVLTFLGPFRITISPMCAQIRVRSNRGSPRGATLYG